MTEPHVSARDSETIPDVPGRLAALAREGAAVAVATVISRRAPVSAQVGDKALIHADGRMEGFVGGACSREIVRRQALLSLQGGQARLVQIVPGASAQGAEHAFAERVTVPMNCASEGESEVFIEPLLPPRLLVVVGHTPVAQAIATHARLMGDRVWRVLDDDEAEAQGGQADVVPLGELAERLTDLPAAQRVRVRSVVASQGHYDESALEVLLRAQPNPVGVLASRRRTENVRETLRMLSSFSDAELGRIRGPVGLDLGARTPHEVAVSILAEMVQLDRAGKGAVPVAPVPAPAPVPAEPAPPVSPLPAPTSSLGMAVMGLDVLPVAATGTAIDPVCGMTVTLPAKHTAEHAGTEYAFCCPHCKARFLKEPGKYLGG